MGHVVVHRDATGAWQLEDVASLDAALQRIETLRNTEGCGEVRLLEEIALQVQTYYRVAVADARVPSPSPAGTAQPTLVADPAPAAEPTPPVAELRSPFDTVEASAGPVAGGSSAPVGDPPPGAFPLAAPPVPTPPAPTSVGDEDDAAEPAVAGGRRARFSRER